MSASPLGLCLNIQASAQQVAPSDLAQQSGRALEDQIEQGFRERGFEIIKASDWDQSENRDDPNLRKVILDAPYASIYGHAARIEFLLLVPGQRILIEVKRQRTSGSTDEKLPYVYANAELNIGFGQEFVLIMDGDGWKDGAVRWIRERDAENESFSVFTPDEFSQWLERF
jgi:hypothetical protein